MNLLKHIFSKTISKAPVYYDSIYTLPIAIFNQIIETSDYSLLVTKGKLSKSEAYKIWFNIYNEFLETFGTPKQYQEYVRLMRKWRDEIIRVSNGEKWRQSFAKIALNEANLVMKEVENNFYKTLTYVSQLQGYPIDPMRTSVYMFYAYLKSQEEQNG